MIHTVSGMSAAMLATLATSPADTIKVSRGVPNTVHGFLLLTIYWFDGDPVDADAGTTEGEPDDPSSDYLDLPGELLAIVL